MLQDKLYCVRVGTNGERYYIGKFRNENAAGLAYNKAVIERNLQSKKPLNEINENFMKEHGDKTIDELKKIR